MNTEERLEVRMNDMEDGNFFKGTMWAVLLSIPLWISFIGWVKLISYFIK